MRVHVDRAGDDVLARRVDRFVGSDNAAFVTDEIVDRFCLVGSAENHLVRLRELERAGVNQFNLYLMNGNEEEQLELYGRDIIPAMRGAPAA